MFSYIDVLDPSMREVYIDQKLSSFTDGIHPKMALPLELTKKEEISEATKRAKLSIVKRLIDTYSMDRVLVSIFYRFNVKIFCRTNLDCDNLESFFIHEGNGQKVE